MPQTQYRPEDPAGNGWPHRAASGEELLPPVEPPPAGFILKLFVIPALIVVVLLAVWQVPKWLVRRTSVEPHELVQQLEQGSSIARFQTAFDLAIKLGDKQFEKLRRDPKAADELARILVEQIDEGGNSGGMKEEEVGFRMYLAQALGKFEVQEGVGALIKAAETNRDPAEQTVRDGAVKAIAERAYNLHQLKLPQDLTHPELVPALARLASDEEPVIRSHTAYALGKVGTPAAIERLEAMVGDPYPDARYNAAMELALAGNAKAINTLAEMLELSDLASALEETDEASRFNKRALIVSNAILGTRELAKRNPAADFSPLVTALDRLASADRAALKEARISPGVVPEARRTLEEIRKPEAERRID